MKTEIVLISNSFPLNGEPFLNTELCFLPECVSVDVWPFFVDRSNNICRESFANITPHIYDEVPVRGKIKCLLRALSIFFQAGEYKAVFARKGFLRNTAKAIKFAYVSELRLVSIKKWLTDAKNIDRDFLLYSYWMYEAAYVAARIKQIFPKCSFVTRCHGYDLYEERHPNGYLPFRDLILRNADLICPISENGVQYLRKVYGEEISDRIQIARLGTIRKVEISGTQEKVESIVLVSCSNLVAVKRVHLIISALNKCKKLVTWYHFGDGELRSDLEKQAKSLPENVTYTFMGYRANEDIQHFYAEHHINAFINVSRSEGVPVSVMEAESYGIPIIATDVGGTSEIVHDNENGVLLDVDFTSEELLNAIDHVIAHSDKYRENALRTWETMSNASVVFPEFYKKLAEV